MRARHGWLRLSWTTVHLSPELAGNLNFFGPFDQLVRRLGRQVEDPLLDTDLVVIHLLGNFSRELRLMVDSNLSQYPDLGSVHRKGHGMAPVHFCHLPVQLGARMLA